MLTLSFTMKYPRGDIWWNVEDHYDLEFRREF